jgi:hypothetical protein
LIGGARLIALRHHQSVGGNSTMRILGLSIAAAAGAALYLMPVTGAFAQPACTPMPTKPKSCVDWVCKTSAYCQVKDGPGVVGGCVAWKCNAVARKK